MNTKTILTVLVVGGVGYYLFNQWKKKQGTKNFANYVDDDFMNLEGGKKTKQATIGGTGSQVGAQGCEIVTGNVGYTGMPLGNNRIICRTGNGSTLICPRSQWGRDCGNR
jgi:hypothetical protein